MSLYKQILNLFDSDTEESFNTVAIKVFRYQAIHNPIYKHYLGLIDCDIASINRYESIPLLPITLFKQNNVKTKEWESQKVFLSSGTSDFAHRSKHHIKDIDWYNSVAKSSFLNAGFSLDEVEILSLLPSYVENGDSSLVHMVSHLQELSGTQAPASFLYNLDDLMRRINDILENSDKKIILFGVTYALLDLSKTNTMDNERLSIIFTGGMKNKGLEISYQEIVSRLRESFISSDIHSEYGMTELLSQAYAASNGRFVSSPLMRVISKQLQDPYENARVGKTGVVGIIDLANIDSLSFIQTQDLGIKYSNREFELAGRMDDSDLRGCNLLYETDYF